MAMVYLTGEIPANINNYIKRKKLEGVTDPRQLFVAGVGALGMLNRIKFAPVVGSLMQKLGLKQLLDLGHNQFEKMFLGYFSLNRWLLHDVEREEAEEVASAHDLTLASKHENLYKKFTLPLRVILGDDEVSYKADTRKGYVKPNVSIAPTT